jgi:hypothetical protein
MDGHPRQNPAYRPAKEKASETGLFLWTDSPATRQARPAAGVTAVSVEPLGTVARRALFKAVLETAKAAQGSIRVIERTPDTQPGRLRRLWIVT